MESSPSFQIHKKEGDLTFGSEYVSKVQVQHIFVLIIFTELLEQACNGPAWDQIGTLINHYSTQYVLGVK